MHEQAFRIRATAIRPGMMLAYFQSSLDIIVDDVDVTRDGDVKVSVGLYGTGTEFFRASDYVWVRYQ